MKTAMALAVLLGLGGVAAADEQAKIGKIISDICDAFAKKDADKLESFHAYGPKFTKFEDDGLGRQDAAAGKKGERDAMTMFKSASAKVNELKIDVFGQTAVATFILDWSADDGKQKMAGKDRATLVFTKEGGSWKIVHEHLSPLKS